MKKIRTITYSTKVNDAAQELISRLEMWIVEGNESMEYWGATSSPENAPTQRDFQQLEDDIAEAKRHIEYIKENLTLYEFDE